jgi:hypothetical protein
MLVYNYRPDNHVYVGTSPADPDPLNPGNWLIPANATVIPVPNPVPPGQRAVFVGDGWMLQNIPQPPTPPQPPAPPAHTPAEYRASAYRNESDPLFFMMQRGEATEAQWLAKIEEIKQRYPDNP